MLLVVWVSAFVPLTWVMGVAVGVSWWCVFQWCVAVVSLSRRVPGVVVCVCVLVFGVCVGVAGLVFGVGGLVWACFGVGWLVFGVGGLVWACVRVVGASVGVCWLVCVVWFRMLMCVRLSFFLVLSFVCFVLFG